MSDSKHNEEELEEKKTDKPSVSEEDFKNVVAHMQWKFEQKFPAPPKGSVPKKEHLFAFYQFYDEEFKNTDNELERIICLNQKKNIMNMANYIHKLFQEDFINLYVKWYENKVYPPWN